MLDLKLVILQNRVQVRHVLALGRALLDQELDLER